MTAFGSMDSLWNMNLMSMMEKMAGEKPKSSLRRDIDENLKRVYEDALKDEIPDRFKLLLEQLKAKEAKK